MADEILRSRHAFGDIANIDKAIADKKVDAYDILFLSTPTGHTIGWIDKEGNKVILPENNVTNQVVVVSELPKVGEEGIIYVYGNDGYIWNGKEFVNMCKPTDLTELEEEIATKANSDDVDAKINETIKNVNAYTNEEVEEAMNEIDNSYKKIKYEISHKPVGTLVDYRDKEIRVMCPENTVFTKQTVGGTGNANMYYMGFKAYAPEGAVGFKEGDRGVIVDEMFDFTGDFAGTDAYGRNYSIVWLALASYDETSDTWTYFGKNSSVNKYIGWTYVVEWYDADGVVIESDSIRINLSNEECHSSIEPYYVKNTVNEANAYTDEQIAEIINSMAIVEF